MFCHKDADETSQLVFCDTCARATHLTCNDVKAGRKSKRKKLKEKDAFECGVCEGAFKGQDPFDDMGVINIGVPAKQQALAVIYRGNIEIMQCMSTYYSPWYENGNPLKWNGKHYAANVNHPLYEMWQGIITRTRTNSHYIKNKVTMYAAWVGTYRTGPSDGARNRFDPIAWFSFLYYVDRFLGPKPCFGTPQALEFTMDRINPYLSYEPGNIRWAWVALQVNNQMRKKGTYAQFQGKQLQKMRHALKKSKPQSKAEGTLKRASTI